MPSKIKMDINDITYERKHNESYMVVEGKLLPDSYETKMINENDINALLEMTTLSIDGVNKISYRISRKETLEDFVESNDLDKENLARLIINIKIALDTLNNYLIDERHIWLSKETVYLNKGGENYHVTLCYLPIEHESIQSQFRDIMEFFLSKLTIKDREESKQVYEAYDICLKEDYTLDEVIECLQQTEDTRDEIYVEKVVLEDEGGEESYVEEIDEQEEYFAEYKDKAKPKEGLFSRLFKRTKNFVSQMNFEDSPADKETEDFIIEPDYELEEKTVLLTDTKPVGRLVYDGVNNEDDFIITKDTFRIGSGKNNDAVIKNKTVSGSHAKITKTGNDFYIMDSNSTNGSFLNNLQLVYRKPYKLRPMDKIQFATEAYIFY